MDFKEENKMKKYISPDIDLINLKISESILVDPSNAGIGFDDEHSDAEDIIPE